VRERQANRIIRQKNSGIRITGLDAFCLVRDDVLGPKVTDLSNSSSAWQELDRMVGLRAVKKSALSLFSLVQTNLELEEEEKPLQQVALNRLFLGNFHICRITILYSNKYYTQVIQALEKQQ
jgi:hypothetical protein